jgi:hypothetical protein
MKYGLQIIIGLYRISYNDAFETTKVENITQKSKKDTNDFGVKIFEFRNEIFLIHKTWYTYNSISNQLVKTNCLIRILKIHLISSK